MIVIPFFLILRAVGGHVVKASEGVTCPAALELFSDLRMRMWDGGLQADRSWEGLCGFVRTDSDNGNRKRL